MISLAFITGALIGALLVSAWKIDAANGNTKWVGRFLRKRTVHLFNRDGTMNKAGFRALSRVTMFDEETPAGGRGSRRAAGTTVAAPRPLDHQHYSLIGGILQ